MRLCGWLGLCGAVLVALPLRAATLPDALHRWTGTTLDVIGRGPNVQVLLPPPSPVPQFVARARPGNEGGDAGWALDDILLASPLKLAGGTLAVREQQASGFLGAQTAHVSGAYGGLSLHAGRSLVHLDHATVAVAAANGPVHLDLALDGLREADIAPDLAGLLPRHVVVAARTTEQGLAALVAMFGGRPAGTAAVVVERLDMDEGAAHISGDGAVTLLAMHDRRGELHVSVVHFDDLLRQIPADGPAAKLYATLMILRQMAHKQDGALRWTIGFDGPAVLVNGLDIGPLLGW